MSSLLWFCLIFLTDSDSSGPMAGEQRQSAQAAVYFAYIIVKFYCSHLVIIIIWIRTSLRTPNCDRYGTIYVWSLHRKGTARHRLSLKFQPLSLYCHCTIEINLARSNCSMQCHAVHVCAYTHNTSCCVCFSKWTKVTTTCKYYNLAPDFAHAISYLEIKR